ncbi:hypothetical protein [Olivibacter sp. XZL3]|uniref:hypothetical protein n=1 Tax=Olivibacter sp. XZL3 TaxID=1735116 RepID=UPI001416F8B7|nr:hypothetical protein [Olivibacter sp. XZL3]
MEKFTAEQIEQFLKVDRVVTGSADHHAVANGGGFLDEDGDTVSGITITTSFVAGGI